MDWLQTVNTALSSVTRFSFLSEGPETDKTTDKDVMKMFALFPVVALMPGLAGFLLGGLLRWLSTPVIAAFLGAVFIPVLLYWITGFRGIKGVVSVAEEHTKKHAETDFVRFLQPYTVPLALQAMFLVKAVTIGLLIYTGHPGWLVAVMALSAAAYAETMLRTYEMNVTPFHWLIAAIAAVLVGGLYGQLINGLLSVILAWLLAHLLIHRLSAHAGEGEAQNDPSGAVLEAVELSVLVVGVILFAAQ